MKISSSNEVNTSVGKESTCNAGDPVSIPGLGRYSGEGIGYPLQHSWASLVAQLVKNLPAMQETPVWSLVWEDPLEKGKATHSRILAGRIPWVIYFMGLQRVGHDWSAFIFTKYEEDWDHEMSSWKYLSKDMFHKVPWSTECLTLHPVEVQLL